MTPQVTVLAKPNVLKVPFLTEEASTVQQKEGTHTVFLPLIMMSGREGEV